MISGGHGTPRMMNRNNSKQSIDNQNNPRDSDYLQARDKNAKDEIRELMNEMNN